LQEIIDNSDYKKYDKIADSVTWGTIEFVKAWKFYIQTEPSLVKIVNNYDYDSIIAIMWLLFFSWFPLFPDISG
jgi:hypothetical protein